MAIHLGTIKGRREEPAASMLVSQLRGEWGTGDKGRETVSRTYFHLLLPAVRARLHSVWNKRVSSVDLHAAVSESHRDKGSNYN